MNTKKSGCGCGGKSSQKSASPAAGKSERSSSVVIPTDAYSDVRLNGNPPVVSRAEPPVVSRVAAVPAANQPDRTSGRAASKTLAASANKMSATRSAPRSKPVFLDGVPFTGVK